MPFVCTVQPRTIAFSPMGEAGVVVGRVIDVRFHPLRDFIWLSTVDTGMGDKRQIVWGGIPIVTAGCLVPVAQPGAWLPANTNIGKPNPYKIRRRRYAGEVSEGMLCSLAELGWDPVITKWVALLDSSAKLEAGQSLTDLRRDWRELAVPIDACEAERRAGRQWKTVDAEALLTGPVLSGPGWRVGWPDAGHHGRSA